MVFFLFVTFPFFCSSATVCTIPIEVSPEQSKVSFICIHSAVAAAAAAPAAALYCYTAVVGATAAACSLLFVIVCRVAKVVAGSFNLIPMFSFSSFERDLFLMVTLGSSAVSQVRLRFAYLPTR